MSHPDDAGAHVRPVDRLTTTNYAAVRGLCPSCRTVTSIDRARWQQRPYGLDDLPCQACESGAVLILLLSTAEDVR